METNNETDETTEEVEENTVDDETTSNVVSDEDTTVDLSTISNQLGEAIFYEQHIYSTEIIFVACFFVILVIYLIYKFISKFVEF